MGSSDRDMVDMKVEIKPPERVVVLGVDNRSVDNLTWCGATFGVNRLFWVDGYLLCLEVYEKSFEHEIEGGAFYISQVCYARFPRYARIFEVEKGTQIPVVDASDMGIYRILLETILRSVEE